MIAKNATRLEEADLLYRQAISMRADYTQAYINRGDVLIKLNRTKEAQEVYERALFYDSNNPDIYYNVSIELLRRNIYIYKQIHYTHSLKKYKIKRIFSSLYFKRIKIELNITKKLNYINKYIILIFYSLVLYSWNKEKHHKLWHTWIKL